MVTQSVLISGTVAAIEDLVEVITVLCGHGLAPIDTLVTPVGAAHGVPALR